MPNTPSPMPPFTLEGAIAKVRRAEDLWNSRAPLTVVSAYTQTSTWRDRERFLRGHDQILAFLEQKWHRELDYRLIKELWTYHDNRIAVRFFYEWHDASGQWFRSYGCENWEFDQAGLMIARHASVNDKPILPTERKFLWPLGPRPEGFPGATELGL